MMAIVQIPWKYGKLRISGSNKNLMLIVDDQKTRKDQPLDVKGNQQMKFHYSHDRPWSLSKQPIVWSSDKKNPSSQKWCLMMQQGKPAG